MPAEGRGTGRAVPMGSGRSSQSREEDRGTLQRRGRRGCRFRAVGHMAVFTRRDRLKMGGRARVCSCHMTDVGGDRGRRPPRPASAARSSAGLNIPAHVTGMLGASGLSFDGSFDQEEIRQILRSLDDLRKGMYEDFDDVDELIADLHSP